MNRHILLFAIFLSSCNEQRSCNTMGDAELEKLAIDSYTDSKIRSQTGLVFSKYPSDNIKVVGLDRAALRYLKDSVAIIKFQRNGFPIFEAMIFEDCEIQWMPS